MEIFGRNICPEVWIELGYIVYTYRITDASDDKGLIIMDMMLKACVCFVDVCG